MQQADMTIAEIVRSDYRTADVFKRHNINYCCSGQVTLQAACDLGNLDYDAIAEELEHAKRNIHLPNSLQFNEWKTDFLIDYILNVHHAYLKHVLPVLGLRLNDFVNGHKKKYPELEHILEIFNDLAGMLETHTRHEEDIIFPYIKQMDAAHRRKEPYANLFVRTLRKPLGSVQREHSLISALLKKLKLQSNDFACPENACTNHQVLYHKLREFHDDMVQHKHLENNILIPRAIEIENELLRL
jgi:regulator of cell morphogenesis and NO signaling